MSKLLFLCALAAVFSVSLALTCTDPTVESTSFTTIDATIVSQIAFISEFTLKCSNKASETTSLFAEFDGKLSPVARVGSDRFQVRKDSPMNSALTKDMLSTSSISVLSLYRLGQLDGRYEESPPRRPCHSFVR